MTRCLSSQATGWDPGRGRPGCREPRLPIYLPARLQQPHQPQRDNVFRESKSEIAKYGNSAGEGRGSRESRESRRRQSGPGESATRAGPQRSLKVLGTARPLQAQGEATWSGKPRFPRLSGCPWAPHSPPRTLVSSKSPVSSAWGRGVLGWAGLFLNEHAQSNSLRRFAFIPIFQFHPGGLWLEKSCRSGAGGGVPGVCRAREPGSPEPPPPPLLRPRA